MTKPQRYLQLTIASAALLSHPAEGADVTDSFLMMFKPLPDFVPALQNELTEDKVNLGRQLYYDKRFSIAQDISCNSCHVLDKYGTDNAAFSTGHKGQKGGRSAPTVFNAALHIAQFWDGRAPTVEEQAKGPVLNPIEMGMPSAEHVIKVIKSIPGYVEAFAKAFPDETDPVNYDNFGKAIGAFERKLLTPAPWDDYLKGNKDALNSEEKEGFKTFVQAGCVTCHNGPGVGGHMYQKLGLAKPWPELNDLGRYEATKNESDKFFFKVPTLRNITETGPFLHDGSVKELPLMVRMMAEYQLGKTLTDTETASIVAFLKSLKGNLPDEYIKEPQLPPNGPNTPGPEKS
jgi:cytochrome c peroxidase